MKKYLVLLSVFFLLSSCSEDKDDNFPCTGPPVAGIKVLVKDAVTSDVLTDGVTVVATDGDFSETLVQSGNYFIGVYDRQSNYTVTVTKTGYQNYVSGPVSVFKPGCHALVTDVAVNLQPE